MANIPHPGHGQVRSFRMPAEFWLRRAERCREQNQPLRAVTILRHAARQEPDSADLLLEYAVQLHDLGCYEVSNRECFDLLSRHPGCFSAFGLVARNMLALGRMGEAMDAYGIYSQYSQLRPDELPEWDEDVYDVEDAMLLLPSAPMRIRLNDLLKHAGQRLQRDDRQKAAALLRRSMQKPFPRRLPQRDALLAIYCQRYGSAQSAKAYALRAVKGAPRTPSLLIPMAMLLYQMHAPAAYSALLRAAACAQAADDLGGVCEAAWVMGCGGVATAMLEQELKRSPYRMAAVYNLCVLRMRQQSLAGVSAYAHRLREIDPDDPAVASLFSAVTRLEDESADPEAIKAAGDAQPFYGVPDSRTDMQSLETVCQRLGEGVEAFAAALVTDRRLYRQLVSLFLLEGNLYTLLPSLCAAMKPEDASALLRRLLLAGGLDERTLRMVCELMLGLGHKPPYLAWTERRLTLVTPGGKPPPSPALLQRLLCRRLAAIARACGSRRAIPMALGAMAAMTDARRKNLAGDRFKVWLPAFKRAYAQRCHLPAPALSGALLSPVRRRAFIGALRTLSQCLKEV